jgi:hypothetical protein
MPFRSGSIGYSRFSVIGDAPAAPDQALFDALRAHLLKPHGGDGIGPAKEVSSGFCTGRHVFDGEFTYEACGFGASLLAAMRVDTAKVPSEIKLAYRTMAEDARRGRDADGVQALSRVARREAKEDAEERCRRDLADGKYRKTSMVPFLWDLPSGLLLAPLTSDAAFQELKSLLDAACSVRLERRSAGTLALELAGARGKTAALEDVLPDAFTERPEGPTREDDEETASAVHFRKEGRPEIPWAHAAGEPNDFLGNLFLLWLWWQCDVNEGLIETGPSSGGEVGGPTVALVIERLLDMECAWGVTGIQNLRGETPTKVAEAAKALHSGKWPRKLGLTLAAHGQEYRLVLQGDRFAVSGLSLPKPDEENRLSPRQMLEQRMDHLLTVDRLLVLLFDTFLRERLGAGWPTRAGQIKEWIATLGRQQGRSPSGAGRTPRAGIVEVKPDEREHAVSEASARATRDTRR